MRTESPDNYPAPGRQLLRRPALSRKVGLSRSTIYRLEAVGLFPRRLRLSQWAVAWDAGEVEAWIEARMRAGGGK